MKVLSLISGGIDSPVASALALEQGAEVEFIHFDNMPFSDGRALEKVRQILELLSKEFNRKFNLYIIPHGEIQKEILKLVERKYTCVICRREMFRASEIVAKEIGADALLTGESMGQVASQTLHNLRAEFGVNSLPVLRPLLGMDKLEIEALAKKYKSFELSIMPGMCCSLVPDRPATKARVEQICQEEMKFDALALAKEASRKKKVETIGAK
ncbi:MAG: tRNA 4-thiouridine(8) synthase ThiI [Candidatus Diapherotrites archaeon]